MFARPGITSLRDQAVNDVLIGMGLPTLLRRSPLRALAYGQAGLAHGHYGYLDWIARQSVPFTAQGSHLEAWAALVGINRLPATAATGTVALTGTTGTVVPAGTLLRRADGASYRTLLDGTLSAGTAIIAIAATTPGAAGTLQDATPLSLAAPINGVQAIGTATHGASGADQELDTALRTRMLQRYAAPPQGGDATDYVEWALAVPGVTRAWVNPQGGGGPGTVTVYTMFDVSESAFQGFPQGTDGVAASETRGTPATGDQLTVANAIYPLRPVTALVYSVAPVPFGISFTLHASTTVPGTVQAAVNAAIDAVFVSVGTPLGQEIELSTIQTAIAGVPGMPSFTIVSPSAPIMLTLGHLPVRGAATIYV